MSDLPDGGGRKRMMKKITLGILANVDAGKTTLSEALLYKAGKISTPGRVDKGNSFLDANAPWQRCRAHAAHRLCGWRAPRDCRGNRAICRALP